MNKELKGLLFGLVAVVLFGFTLPVTKMLTPIMHPLFIGLGRATLAAMIALLILLFSKQSIPTPRQLARLAVVALGVVIGFPVLSAWALQTVPASHGGVVMGILPLATVAAGVLVSHERPSKGFWFVGLVGAGLVTLFSLHGNSDGLVIGDLILVAAIACAAFAYAMGGVLAKDMGGWQVICWALVISLPFIVWPSWYYAPENLSTQPLTIWIAFLYLALFSQLFGFFFWYKGMAIGGVARVSQSQLLQPFVTIVAAALLLGESVSMTTLLFASAVIATVAVSKKMQVHHH